MKKEVRQTMSKFENRVSRKALVKCVAKRLKDYELHESMSDLSKKELEQLVELVSTEFLSELENQLIHGKDVLLVGFGTFNVRTRKGHPVPLGEHKHVDSYRHLKFTPAHRLSQLIRDEKENP